MPRFFIQTARLETWRSGPMRQPNRGHGRRRFQGIALVRGGPRPLLSCSSGRGRSRRIRRRFLRRPDSRRSRHDQSWRRRPHPGLYVRRLRGRQVSFLHLGPNISLFLSVHRGLSNVALHLPSMIGVEILGIAATSCSDLMKYTEARVAAARWVEEPLLPAGRAMLMRMTMAGGDV